MQLLLRLSRGIDWISDKVGAVLIWLVLAAVLISTANAVIRTVFNVFMLGAGYAFLHNAHVRIDFISGKLTPRARNVIDIVGIVAFLAPLCWLLIDLSWPLFMNAWNSGEMSQNAGGLIRWPVYLMIPVGMALLLAQAASELIKRVAFLLGRIPDPLAHKEPGQAHAEETAKELEAAK
jgi:TRAP-type mannitol/chloroaromatic compound transport system permease small subunit